MTKCNHVPDSKIVDKSQFKALEDDKINVTIKLKFVLGMVENFLGKGENDGYQSVFQKPFFLGSLKVGIMW